MSVTAATLIGLTKSNSLNLHRRQSIYLFMVRWNTNCGPVLSLSLCGHITVCNSVSTVSCHIGGTRQNTIISGNYVSLNKFCFLLPNIDVIIVYIEEGCFCMYSWMRKGMVWNGTVIPNNTFWLVANAKYWPEVNWTGNKASFNWLEMPNRVLEWPSSIFY